MNFWLISLLGIITAIGLSFIQAPYNLWPLTFPCFALFYYLYDIVQNKKQAFALTFLFALSYFVSGLHWIGNALLVEGNDYRWVWPLAVIALPTILSLFPALFLTVNFILFRKSPLTKFLGFCLLLSLSEWVRGYIFTGFPWNLYGYGIASNPQLSQILSLIGPYGLTFLVIFWGASFGLLSHPKQPCLKIILPISIVTALLTFGWGSERLSSANIQHHDNIELHLVQANIAQKDKWANAKLGENFIKHVEGVDLPLSPNKKHIIIWPETAIPPIFLNNPSAQERVGHMLEIPGKKDDALLLSGALYVEQESSTGQEKYHNALIGWSRSNGAEKLYSKTHLVPFGEYIPFQKYIPLPTITKFSGFERGNGATTITPYGYPSFSPLICYEIIFPNTAISKKKRPDYILTLTNDAWYGDSAGPYQHYMQAKFRAIEYGIPVVRVANTGISGIINAYGTTEEKLDLLTSGTISAKLPKSIDKPTFYSQYKDLPYLLFLFIGLILTFFLKKKFV